MNAASFAVLAVVGILFALAVRRVAKKGAPCECGGSRKLCGARGAAGCSCGCGGSKTADRVEI